MKRRILLLGVVIAIICVSLLGFELSKNKKSKNNIAFYEALSEKIYYLPSLEEVGDYKTAHCRGYRNGEETICTLIVEYTPEEYLSEKKQLMKTYSFETSPVYDQLADSHGEVAKKEPVFCIDSFVFHLLSLKEYNLYYPKWLAFIAFSDDECTIAFVYYSNQARDVINSPFSEFVLKECGWETLLRK